MEKTSSLLEHIATRILMPYSELAGLHKATVRVSNSIRHGGR
jgi:hypothetical protein